MISHYLGVTTEICTGRLKAAEKKITLGEVLFYFGDKGPYKFQEVRVLRSGICYFVERS